MKTVSLSNEDFENLLKGYEFTFKVGDVVKGHVIDYLKDGVMVEIGAKAYAYCPSKEVRRAQNERIEDVLKKGEEYDFLITDEQNDDAVYPLSHKKAILMQRYSELEEISNKNLVVEGTISAIVKGGILVDVMGVQGFVPASHLISKENGTKVGDTIKLKVLTLDMALGNFILSEKKAVGDTIEDIKRDIFEQVEVGQVVKGIVSRMAEFGAFIDLGGVDGLLPLSQISWQWLDHPKDVLKIGEKIDVEIASVDKAKKRISLSLKNLTPDPWVEAKGKIFQGAVVEGKIIRLRHFGAFVEILPMVEALLPLSEIREYQNRTGNVLEAGAKIEAEVVKFNQVDRKITLSVKNMN